jgi:YidC/Oxa1 family membrane protein insertase
MQIIFDLFNTVFFNPTVNVLMFLLRLLEASSIPGALGLAIIILTVIIRMLIWPLMTAQMKSVKQMADLKPKLDELKKKHGSDKTALALAQQQLYKEAGVNPAAGCLPILIQFPILIALYQVIMAMFEGQHGLDRINNALYLDSWHLNQAPDAYFLGINIASKPGDFMTLGWILLFIPILTGVFQFLQSKMMAPKPLMVEKNDSKKEKEQKQSTDEAIAQVQSQMMYILPVMIAYFSYTLPVGLALYWNTLTIVSMIQQYRISGWGGLDPWVRKIGLVK